MRLVAFLKIEEGAPSGEGPDKLEGICWASEKRAFVGFASPVREGRGMDVR